MKSVEEFIKHLRVMSGTGNGIGGSTVSRLEKIARENGFIKPSEKSEKMQQGDQL